MNICTKAKQLIGQISISPAAPRASTRAVDKRTVRSIVLLGVCLSALVPGIAVAGAPWNTVGSQVLGIFTGGLTRTIAIIAVIAFGIAALAGKLSWDWAVKIILGITFIFGGATIVDYIITAAS